MACVRAIITAPSPRHHLDPSSLPPFLFLSFAGLTRYLKANDNALSVGVQNVTGLSLYFWLSLPLMLLGGGAHLLLVVMLKWCILGDSQHTQYITHTTHIITHTSPISHPSYMSLLGCLKPGKHPIFSTFFIRWWLIQKLVCGLPTQVVSSFFRETPFMCWYYAALGDY